MSALARTTEIDCDARAANEDCINGGSRTRTKYAYDANGNVSSRNGSIIGWTSYNYPSGVSTSTESATFDYGPDRQRWRMVYTGPTGNETTYYATPMFEVVHTSSLTDYRHYLFAGGRVVMQLARSSLGANQRPLLTDHQGSISSIMHGTGTSFVNESFTAYGNRREASTWTGTPTSTELANMISITRQGYTFQTVLGSMGLNHMNGRIEDSITGRFLSPDPRGTIRGNTQSWNRYSYVLNNPVTLIDPTGFKGKYPHIFCVGVEVCPSYAPSPYAPRWPGGGMFIGNSWDGSFDDGSGGGGGFTDGEFTDATVNAADAGSVTDSKDDDSSADSTQSAAQSQTAQSQTSDGTVASPPTGLGSTTYPAQLQVQLNPGNNVLMLTVTNLDTSLEAQALYAISGSPTVDLSMQLFTNEPGGPSVGSPTSYRADPAPGSLTIGPSNSVLGPWVVGQVSGQSAYTSLGYFQGPGAATLVFTQTGPATLGVVLNAQPVPAN